MSKIFAQNKMGKKTTGEDFTDYFIGKKVYGDNFSLEQIQEWFDDEKEGYSSIFANEKGRYRYIYHRLNLYYGYKFLRKEKFDHVLSIGGAYGHELLPIADNIKNITILETSDTLREQSISGISIKYVKPNISGKMPFSDNLFQLITCFGTLHHIPNVTKVLNEIFRVSSSPGFVLIREPIISLGDWRNPRKGLTKRERGIPVKILDKMLIETGFQVIRKSLCMFPLTARLAKMFKKDAYNTKSFVYFDRMLCIIFCFNTKYHRENEFDKMGPTSVFYLLRKDYS